MQRAVWCRIRKDRTFKGSVSEELSTLWRSYTVEFETDKHYGLSTGVQVPKSRRKAKEMGYYLNLHDVHAEIRRCQGGRARQQRVAMMTPYKLKQYERKQAELRK